MSNETGVPRVTVLPAGRAKGALCVTAWANLRAGMRDKAQRVGNNKRKATKGKTKTVAPGIKR